jgi:small conductance mechanosensitive channel
MSDQAFWVGVQTWVTAWGFRLAQALFILLLGWLVARWAGRGVRRFLERAGLELTWAVLLRRAVYLLVLLVALLAALNVLGVQTTSVIALLGAAGLAVALALQSTLAHLAAGLQIIGLRLFRIGDQIEVLGAKGIVSDIQLFHTILVDADQVRIILPNGKVTDNVIRNYPGPRMAAGERPA